MGEARVLIQGMVGVTADESQDGLSRSERERERLRAVFPRHLSGLDVDGGSVGQTGGG
jgi:hypothetical protein